MFKNKNILILGMARSGYEVAKLLSNYNNNITINDLKIEQPQEQIEELTKKGINIVLGEHPEDLLTREIDYLIKNPGIKSDHKYVKKAIEYNIPVINEVEVAYLLFPNNITLIGITGSNGKTTTTTLTYEIIKESKKRVHLTGNIGFPLSSFVNIVKPGDIVVSEVSIQQLCNLNKFKTNISVLTNIYEAHLDFVDGYENYKNIKKRIFNNHTKDDYAILNYDNEEVKLMTSDIASHKEYFSLKNQDVNCYLKGENIYYNNEKIISTNDLKIKGLHNYENIMASILVSKRLNIKTEIIQKVLYNFKGVEHRIEFVKEINGRKVYNDSKSTNNVATITALKSFDKESIILLLGGMDRQQNFDELKEYMDNVKIVVTYGETKTDIEKFCKKNNINYKVVTNLEEATMEAYNNSEKNDIILLSPACASWDQFKDFEERGNKFKEYINKIVVKQ